MLCCVFLLHFSSIFFAMDSWQSAVRHRDVRHINLKSLPPKAKGFSEISGGWNSRLPRWQLTYQGQRFRESVCLLLEANGKTWAWGTCETICRHHFYYAQSKWWTSVFVLLGLIWLCYMMLINLSLVRIVPVWPGNRRDQCLQRVRPGILCELWRAVWCLGVHSGIFGWSCLL